MAPAFQAAFVSAGGYHHHVGLNTWQAKGAPPPPSNATGRRYFTILLPEQAEFDRVAARVRQSGIAVEQTEAGLQLRDPSCSAVMMAVV